MKHTPDMQRVIELMRPGVLTLHGFLGADPRDLDEILLTDGMLVAGLGVTHRELARRLQEILERTSTGLGAKVAIDDHLHADCLEVNGRVPCPWGDGTFQKGEVTLVDDRTGETLRFTPLNIHMIAAHGFYEGRGSRYRIEPSVAHRMLRIDRATE